MSDKRRTSMKRKSVAAEQAASLPPPPPRPSQPLRDLEKIMAEWSLSSNDSSDDASSPTPVTVIYKGSHSWLSQNTLVDITDPNLSRSYEEHSEKVDEVPIPEEWSSGTASKVRRISSPVTLFGELSSTSKWSHSQGAEVSSWETVSHSTEEEDVVSPGVLDQGLIAEGDWGWDSPIPSPSTSDSPSASVDPLLVSPAHSPPRRIASSVPAPTSPSTKTDIDPFVVGPPVMQDVLRKNAELDAELLEYQVETSEYSDGPCPCDVKRHPGSWSVSTISSVHRYSFLLHCKDLEIEPGHVLAANARETIVIYDVPMVDGHPWKKKAEQVLRYIDVEIGLGDQTIYDTLYYHQPCNRKMYLVVSGGRVQGLVVGERLQQAHRILTETECYRDLEEWPVPVRLGINKLWVHVSLRRRHLATALCDLMALKFYKDQTLKKEDFAFNDLTDSGAAFAKLYLKTFKVPLYAGKTGSRQ